MDTMNITLPDSLKSYVQARIVEGGHDSVSDYVCELIRSDQRRKAEERLDALLLEGFDSSEPITVTDEYWHEKKRKLVERFGNIGSQQS